MADLRLRTVTRTSGANSALKDGSVTPHDAILDFVEVPVLVQGFRHMVRSLEFDVCEMALSTYVLAKAHGIRFTALPVFLVRGFHHGAIRVAGPGNVQSPRGLQDQNVGVNRGYTVTTGVWARGILAEEYGVDLDRITWVLSGDEHVADYRPPGNVVSMPAGGVLSGMLADGDLAAVIGVDSPDTVPLIPRPEEAGFIALQRTGHYPINHLIVVRDDLLVEHPRLAGDLFGAFAEAKIRYVSQLRDHSITDPRAIDHTYMRVMELTGRDPLPYGVEPNRAMLEKLLDHVVSQHIVDQRPTVGSLFADHTLDLTA